MADMIEKARGGGRRESFSLPILGKETGGSHPGWNHLTMGIDHLMRRRTQGAGTVKGSEDKLDHGHIPDTFT